MDQLTLPVSLSDSAVFENFYSRGNEQSIKFLKNLTDEKSGNGEKSDEESNKESDSNENLSLSLSKK